MLILYPFSGETYRSLHFQFLVGISTISSIIPDTCAAIYDALSETHLRFPHSEKEWLKIAANFYHRWQYPNCLGAIDGTHIEIVPPPNSGSYYFNYKRFHSIVMMVVADADLRIIYLDVGTNGRVSDGGVYRKSTFYQGLSAGKLHIPTPRRIPENTAEDKFPFVLVGDAAFGLSLNMMRPYDSRNRTTAQKVHDYRLSRARRTSENLFARIDSKFRCKTVPFRLNPQKVVTILKAIAVLHNFILSKEPARLPDALRRELDEIDSAMIESSFPDGSGQGALDRLSNVGSNPYHAAEIVRSRFCEYFSDSGALPFQLDRID